MATQFSHTCPHCNTTGAGFSIAFQWPENGSSQIVQFLALCGVCNRGITVLSYFKSGGTHPDMTRYSVEYPARGYSMITVWPLSGIEVPNGMPENVERFYRQGIESLNSKRWDAAGAMFRKSLDVSTKIIAPDLKGITLFHRINKLVEIGILTSAMGDWSHEIRLDGNDAVHDEDPETESDAQATQKFTEAFLNYSFSLPAMVAANREKRK